MQQTLLLRLAIRRYRPDRVSAFPSSFSHTAATFRSASCAEAVSVSSSAHLYDHSSGLYQHATHSVTASLEGIPTMQPWPACTTAASLHTLFVRGVYTSRALRQQNRHQSAVSLNPNEHAKIQRLLYRKCCKTIQGWTREQQAYALEMEGLETLVRPSLRAALPRMRTTMSSKAILRVIFQFHLPTDTDKMRQWCTQAAFVFLKRASQNEVERRLLAGWAAVVSPSFTALDAAVLVAYIHRHFNPIVNVRAMAAPVVDERLVAASLGAGPPSSSATSNLKRAGPKSTAAAIRPQTTGTTKSYSSHHQGGTLHDVVRELNAAGNPKHSIRLGDDEHMLAGNGISSIMNGHPHRRNKAPSPVTSLDAFSEPILVKLDTIIERCRSAIPAKERARPERHTRLIVKSVLEVVRWEATLTAVKGISGGGNRSASLNAIDEVLIRRQSSHRLLAIIVAHILGSFGLRAVALCHDDIPLVAVYSAHNRDKLQCCVDVVNTAILGPVETRAALQALETGLTPTTLCARLLYHSESAVAQAASFLTTMKRDPNVGREEQQLYDKAARYVAAVVEADAVRRAVANH